MFTTPSELAAMEVNDPGGLLHRAKETLVRFGTAGAPSEVALLLPVFDKPPACSQHVPGYGPDGVFDPETLGAAFVVSKGGSVIKTNNEKARWKLNPGGGNSVRDVPDVPGLRKTHCTCTPCKGQSKTQVEFTPYKFELITFQDKTTASDLYLVINMQRRNPRAAIEEQGEAAAGYAPPASTMAGVGITLTSAPDLLPTRVAVPEPATAEDAPVPTPADAPPTPPLASGSETTPERPASPDEVTGSIERLSLAGAASNSDGGEGGGGAAASDGGAAACAEGGTMLARGARCEITGLVAAAQHNGTRCTLTEFHKAIERWEVQLDGGAALRVKPANLIAIVAPIQGVSDEEAGGTMLARGAR
ncbi:hypothetical protein T484DRAFT_1775472, partial [Baffinella frigidus]